MSVVMSSEGRKGDTNAQRSGRQRADGSSQRNLDTEKDFLGANLEGHEFLNKGQTKRRVRAKNIVGLLRENYKLNFVSSVLKSLNLP